MKAKGNNHIEQDQEKCAWEYWMLMRNRGGVSHQTDLYGYDLGVTNGATMQARDGPLSTLKTWHKQ